MFPSFREYFYFNNSERKGIIVLLLLILLLIIAKESLIYFNPDPVFSRKNTDRLLAEIQESIDRGDSLNSILAIESHAKNETDLDRIEPFQFDPNDLPIEKWQQFGLTEKQAQVIKRYESSGGNFRTKRDVKKMFVISDELFAKMEDHILLPDSISSIKNEFKVRKDSFPWRKKKEVLVNINTADTASFKRLYGIGSVLSKRIVDYRDQLGGFHSKKQLKSIYGLKEEVLLKLDSQLVLDTIEIRQLNINSASADELKSHPLIRWKIANSIVKYREQHGDYKQVKGILQSALIDTVLFKKIEPYLKVQ